MKQKTWQIYNFGIFYIFFLKIWPEWVQRKFLLERKGKVILCWWTKNRNSMGTNSRESGARNLEAESVRSRVESMGGCVKLKTVTDIRQSSTHDTFIAERVYLVLNSLLDWKPVEKLKQRWCDVVSFMCVFFSMRQAAQFCMWQKLWTEVAGRQERRELQ